MRFFNTAGPINCDDHYCLPPLERFDRDEIIMLIDQKKYFVLYAPRQTGKTSCLLALMDYLNDQGTYKALYCNVEAAQAAREDVEQAMNDILRDMASSWSSGRSQKPSPASRPGLDGRDQYKKRLLNSRFCIRAWSGPSRRAKNRPGSTWTTVALIRDI